MSIHDITDIKTLLLELGQRPIAYQPAYARLCGSISGGLILSQAMYWSSRTSDPDGWFWKTQAEWHDELGLTRNELETGVKKLRGVGVIETDKRGIPAKMYYRVNHDRLAVLLGGGAPDLSLDDTLRIYGSTLNQLSKSGYSRAVRAGVKPAEYVDYREVLQRDGMVCGICQRPLRYGPGDKGPMMAFDHIIPIAQGGAHVPQNLQPTHVQCNSSWGDADKFVPAGQTEMSQRHIQKRPGGTNIHTENTSETTPVADATKPKRRTTKPRYENLTDTEREMFDAFWSAYPHYPGRSKKAETVTSWHRLDVGDDLFVQIMDALAWFKKSPDWTRDNGQAVPGAQVWLNQERWQDAQGAPAPTNITPIHGQQQEVDTSLITFPDGTTDRCPKELYGTERTTWFKRRWAEWQRTNTQGGKK